LVLSVWQGYSLVGVPPGQGIDRQHLDRWAEHPDIRPGLLDPVTATLSDSPLDSRFGINRTPYE
jgi:hypothetical protein